MEVIDEKVAEAFNRLKQENSSYELKHINGGHYVYLSFGRWDRVEGRTRKSSLYKGKITQNGIFVAAKTRHKNKAGDEEADAPTEAEAKPDGIGMMLKEDIKIKQNSRSYEKTLLTALSMNGRITLPVLSKMLSLSINATNWQVRSLEKRYGIRYIPEIDVGKFGYLQFFITVKFLNDIPPADKLRQAASIEPRVQLAMLTKGEFDLAIFALAKSAEEAFLIVKRLRKDLSDYESIWNILPIYEDYGCIPLRGEFIELLNENSSILNREYAVLKELNKDASMEFSKIDEKYGFDEGRSNYTYYKLRSEGKIKRVTLTMQRLPVRYVGIILKNVINNEKFLSNRHTSLSDIISETKVPTNRYVAVYDKAAPDGSMLFVPVFEYDELDKVVDSVQKLDLGIKLTTLVISNVLVGEFCYRKFDNAYSVQQQILENEYKNPRIEKIDYEENGRRKPHTRRLDIRGARVAEEPFEVSS